MGFNSYRKGNTSFLRPKLIIDAGKSVAIVIQFVTNDRTDNGQLSKIRRKYVKDVKVIENTVVNISANSISDDFRNEQKSAFDDTNDIGEKGKLS
jgi:hypothetical protein